MALSPEMRLTKLDGVYDTLRSLPAEVVSQRGGPIRAALRKGATVFLKEAQKNLQAQTTNATKEDYQPTLLLLKSLTVTRGKPDPNSKGERYVVRILKRTYARPGRRPVTTLKTGSLLEYGSAHQPAEPWAVPAFKAKVGTVIDVVVDETVRGVEAIVKKLAAQNSSR